MPSLFQVFALPSILYLYRWEAGQRLAMKLLLKLYDAASQGAAGSSLEDKLAAAGGVSQDLVNAYKAVLEDKVLDGSFKV